MLQHAGGAVKAVAGVEPFASRLKAAPEELIRIFDSIWRLPGTAPAWSSPTRKEPGAQF
jgi:hypothetical protein